MSTPARLPGSPSLPALKRALATYDWLAYFVLAFALSWLVVSPLLLARNGLAGLPPDLPVEPFMIAGAFAGPTLAAFILTGLQDGRAGIRHLLGRYLHWRVGLRWYLLVLAGPLLALTLGAIPFLGLSIVRTTIASASLLLSIFLPALLAGAILGPLWEEPGWRGFALPRLQRRFGPLASSLLLGLLWGLWHLPGFFGGWLGPPTASAFAALLLAAAASSVVFTWVYNNTRGSLLLMILLHASFNAALAFGGELLPAAMPAGLATLVHSGWIPAVTYLAWAVLLVVATGGRLSSGAAPGA